MSRTKRPFFGPLTTVMGLTLLGLVGAPGCGGSSGGGGGGAPVTPPTVSISVNPTTGSTAGGDVVTITLTGEQFGNNPEAFFDGVAATAVNRVSATVLEATTPAASMANTVDVSVTLDGPGSMQVTETNAFTYQAITITGVTPNVGDVGGGTNVSITGTGFVNVTSVSILSTFTVVSTTQLTGTTAGSPGGAGTVDVTINSSTNGSATLTNGFTYQSTGGGGSTGTIGIVALDINSGPTGGGTVVTISGNNFEPGMQTVSFGGNNATISSAPNTGTIVCTSPMNANSGPVDVVVTSTNNGTATLTDGFNYFAAGAVPVLNQINPNTAPESGGTNVTVTGSGFLGADDVRVGPTSLLNFLVVDDTTITGTIAPLPSGSVAPLTAPVVVTSSANGNSSQAVNFTFSESLFVDQIVPNQGPNSGGTLVKILGRNFSGGNVANVMFNGINATFTVINDNEISVTTPATVARDFSIDVVITGNGISDAIVRQGYTYGEVFDEPSPPGSDSLDPSGDRLGPSVSGATAEQMMLDAIGTSAGGSRSRIATAAFTPYNGEFLATTLTVGGANQVYINGGSVFQSVVSGSLVRYFPSFTETVLGTSSTPTDLVWTYINGDGVPDILVSQEDGSIQPLFPGSDPGDIATGAMAGTPVAGGASATRLAVGDFNNDLTIDAVTLDGQNLQIFLGDGMGGFNAPTAITLPGTETPVEVLVADPNGLRILGLTFEDHQSIIDRISKGFFLDFNRDGNADIATANSQGTITILFGDGMGDFPLADRLTLFGGTPLGNPVDMVLTDSNNDSRPDLAVLTDTDVKILNSRFSRQTNQTNVALVTTLSFPLASAQERPTSLTSVDVNFDCRDDIVVASFEAGGPQVGLYQSNGDGSYSPAALYVGETPFNQNDQFTIIDVAPTRRRSIQALVDFDSPPNGDTMALSNNKGIVELDQELLPLFRGDAPNTLSGPFNTGAAPRGIKFGDLNDDGRTDVIHSSFADDTITARLGNGNGTFGAPLVFATNRGPEALALGDVDLDGDLDVIVTNNYSGARFFDFITVHLNTGQGTLGAGIEFSLQARTPRDVILRDVNADGDLDIITVNQATNNVSVLYGQAGASFAPALVYAVGDRPQGLAVADMGTPEGGSMLASGALAPDGLPDIITANSGHDTISILYNGFSPSAPGTPGQFGQGEAYPLNGFVHPNLTTAIAALNAMNPVPIIFRDDVEPRDVLVADMNEDGFLDIVTCDQGTNTVSILHANGYNRADDPLPESSLGQTMAMDPCVDMNLALSNNGYTQTRNTIGGIQTGPGGMGVQRKYFIPRDYRYNADENDIGSPQITLPAGMAPHFVRTADMNVDGRPDLVIGTFGSSEILIFINLGDDTQSGTAGPNMNVMTTCMSGSPPGFPAYVTFPEVILPPGLNFPGETTFRSPRFATTNPVPGYSTDAREATFFTVPVPGPVTGLDVARVNDDCPPDIGVVTENQMLIIQRGE